MNMLNKQTKTKVIEKIIKDSSYLGKYSDYDGVLTFLSKVWNLKEMPSEDPRFKNAHDDVFQHLVNNQDWSDKYLYFDRLKIIDNDEKFFILFIETVVNPTVRISKEEVTYYVSTINNIIQPYGFRLILTDYFEELPVYKVREDVNISDLPNDIIENKIPIYKPVSKQEIEYPCAKLHFDNWNDYGFVTMFDIVLHMDPITKISLGQIKIMKRDTQITNDTLQDKFTTLSNDYCSLGQDKEYYLKLKQYLGNEYYSFLLGLRDVAIFPKIHEQFENNDIYTTSLIRGNDVERLARTIRFELEGINPNEYYKFNYIFQPPYSQNKLTFNFDFEYNTDFEHRIFALIGKNGTGKTKLLTSLAKNLSIKESVAFSPRKPTYGKIFTISYSVFDRFEIPNSDASFNYVYCGLKKNNNTWKTEDEMVVDFYSSVKLIKEKNLESEWYSILCNFINQDILSTAFTKVENLIGSSLFEFNEKNFSKVLNLLSAGQSIILFMISEILSHIRYDSLILFDEPETHLHPNAISSLLNTLFDLVNRFQSFCVIATHSPMIVQEIPSKNIFVIERNDSYAYVRNLERESFGENLTVITQDIFGNREVPKHFKRIIEGLISKGKSYSEIVSILECDNLPLTTTIMLYIKAMLQTN